ncbi:MAG: hypothetical protein V1747_09525 [Candidatus Omnitrophota bacterium]
MLGSKVLVVGLSRIKKLDSFLNAIILVLKLIKFVFTEKESLV